MGLLNGLINGALGLVDEDDDSIGGLVGNILGAVGRALFDKDVFKSNLVEKLESLKAEGATDVLFRIKHDSLILTGLDTEGKKLGKRSIDNISTDDSEIKKLDGESFSIDDLLNQYKEDEEEDDDDDENEDDDYDEDEALTRLENFIPTVQTMVSESHKIDFNTLKQIQDYLDVLEDNADCIDEDNFNNIERCKRKLEALFKRCENFEEIQVDADLILESFDHILDR